MHNRAPVQVRAGGESGRSDESNHLALLDDLTFFGDQFRQVDVMGSQALAVVDTDGPAVQAELAADFDFAAGHSPHRRTRRAALIGAAVVGPGGLAIVQSYDTEWRVLAGANGSDE